MKPLELLGVYSVPVATAVRDLIEKWLPDPNMVRREIDGLALVAFEVRNLNETLSPNDFGQSGTGQAAWMASFFRAESFTPFENNCIPEGEDSYRLCFFLHYFSRHEPIRTPHGDFWWENALIEAPKALVEACPYLWPWA